MRELLLTTQALADLTWWMKTNPRVALKIAELLEELPKAPFTGKGKPEALKYEFAGCWSRRLTSEHRLIYEVTKDYVRVLNCRHHYHD
jgi:toxin YoeB